MAASTPATSTADSSVTDRGLRSFAEESRRRSRNPGRAPRFLGATPVIEALACFGQSWRPERVRVVVELSGREIARAATGGRPRAPYLYTLLLTLLRSCEGEVVEVLSSKVGLSHGREIKDGQLLVNGVPILDQGGQSPRAPIPETGHYVSTESMIQDILVMKRHNLNAVQNVALSGHTRMVRAHRSLRSVRDR